MHKWYHPSPRKELKPIPWLHPDVISHLENIIQPDFEVIEHGSGGSTLWLAARCKSVIAFEDDEDWQAVVRSKIPDNATVTAAGGFMERKQYDLILIDGEPVEQRAEWLRLVPDLIKPGGWVVLDNANRPEYARERQHLEAYAAEYKSFNVNEGGTMYLMTDFFHLPETEGLRVPEPIKKPKRKKKGGE